MSPELTSAIRDAILILSTLQQSPKCRRLIEVDLEAAGFDSFQLIAATAGKLERELRESESQPPASES